MKQSIYTLTAAIFLVLCTACTEADTVLPQAGGGQGTGQGTGSHPDRDALLSVKELGLSLEVISRAAGIVTGGPQQTANNPNPVKRVGICVTKQIGHEIPTFYDPTIPTKIFSYSESVWEQVGEPPLYLNTDKGRVYAYAPEDKNVELNMDGVPLMKGVVVKASQVFQFNDATSDISWKTDQEDYLYCQVANEVDRWNPTVSLNMQHALAKVSFRVTEKDGGTLYAGSKVTGVTLKSEGGNHFYSSANGQMQLAAGGVLATTTVGILTFSAASGSVLREVGSGSGGATVPVQAFGLVLPVSGFEATLELTLDDGHVFASPLFDVNWVAGQNYIYTLTLSPKGITIGTPKVTNWEDATIPDPNVPMD